MPVARVQIGDKIGRFEVPEGTSPEQAEALAMQSMQDVKQGATTTTPTSKSWGDTAAELAPAGIRTAGAIAGPLVSAGMAASGFGAPAALPAGLATTALFDAGAQGVENWTGQRDGYNPMRGLVETATSRVAPIKAASGTLGVGKQALKGGVAQVGMETAADLAEGQRPSWDQQAARFVLGSVLGGATGKWLGSKKAAREAEELVGLRSAEEYAQGRSTASVYEGEYVGETSTLDLPMADATPIALKQIGQQKGSYSLGPREQISKESMPSWMRENMNLHPILDSSGNRVGDMTLSSLGSGGIHVHDVHMGPLTANYTTNLDRPLNVSGVRNILRDIKRLYPDTKEISGLRATGSHKNNLLRVAKVPKYIQDDYDEINTEFKESPEPSDTPANTSLIQKEVTYGEPPAEPPYSGGIYKQPPGIEGPRGKQPKDSLQGRFTPMHRVMSRIQENTDLPVYDDWRTLRALDQRMRVFKDRYIRTRTNEVTGKPSQGLDGIFKGTSKRKRQAFTQWLEAEDKEGIEATLGFTTKDKISVRHLRNFYNDLFKEFDVDADDYLINYSPHLRKMGADELNMFMRDPKVPQEIKFFAEFMRTGELSQLEDDALKNAAAYLHQGAFKKYMGPVWNVVHDRYAKSQDAGGLIDPKNPYHQEARDEFTSLLNHYRYKTPDVFGKNLQLFFNRIGKLTGGKVQINQRDVIAGLLNMQTMGTLAGSPKAMMMNTMQIAQTGGTRLGPKWLARGINEAMTATGRARAEMAGASQGALQDLFEIQELATNPVNRVLSKATQIGMKPYGGIESWGRSVVYNGQYLKTMEAAKKAKTVEEFLSRSDIDMMPPVVQRRAKVAFAAGSPERAADDAADYLIQETLFGYGPLERPAALRKELGRTIGSYGVWPMNYMTFAKNLASNGPKWKRARDATRFGVISGAIGLGMKEAKDLFNPGEPDNSALGEIYNSTISPIFYRGGPLLEAGIAGADYMRQSNPNEMIKYRAKRAASNLLPYNRLGKSFMEAYKETDLFRATGRLLEMGPRNKAGGAMRPIKEIK